MLTLRRVKILTVQYNKKMTVSFFPFFAFYSIVSGSSQPKNKSGIILICIILCKERIAENQYFS